MIATIDGCGKIQTNEEKERELEVDMDMMLGDVQEITYVGNLLNVTGTKVPCWIWEVNVLM